MVKSRTTINLVLFLAFLFGLVFAPTTFASSRTTPFSVGETTDPGLDAQPCGPTDTNCFPSLNALQPVGTTTGSGGIMKFLELLTNGINYIGFRAPDAITTNTIWTLPSGDGLANTVLTTDGSGTLSWTNPGASGVTTAGYFTATSTTATSSFAGGFTVGTNKFLVDLSTGNVGVGTTSPYAKLSVAGEIVGSYFTATSTTATSTFTAGVNVGSGNGYFIGGTQIFAYSSLHGLTVGVANTVSGGSATGVAIGYANSSSGFAAQAFGYSNQATSTNAVAFGYLNKAGGTGSVAIGNQTNAYASQSVAIGKGITNTTASSLQIGPSDAAKLTILNSGYVGIGTTSPSSLLHVNGTGLFGSGTGMGLQINEGSNLQIGSTSLTPTGSSIFFGDSNLVRVYEKYDDSLAIYANAGDVFFAGENASYTGIEAKIGDISGQSHGYYLNINGAGASFNSNVGIGTTSPYAKLSVVGAVVADSFNATSTTATSSFTAGVNVGTGNGYFVNGARALSGAVNTPTSFGFSNNVSISGSAFGNSNTSSNVLSNAFGYGNTASGFFGNAFGYANQATSSNDIAFGYANNAGGGNSVAFGYGNNAWATNAVAIGASVTNTTANSLMIGPSNAAKLTILSSGNVGIGTTSPYAKLSVVGDVVADSFNATSTTATSTILGKLAIGRNQASSNVNGTYFTGGLTSWLDNVGIDDVEIGLGRADNTTAAAGSMIFGGRSRGTLAAPLTVVANDTLFTLQAVGHDGTDFAKSSLISFDVDGTPGANVMPGRITFSTSPAASQTPAERMRIDSAGNIGIGTTSPNAKLNTYSLINANGQIGGLSTDLRASLPGGSVYGNKTTLAGSVGVVPPATNVYLNHISSTGSCVGCGLSNVYGTYTSFVGEGTNATKYAYYADSYGGLTGGTTGFFANLADSVNSVGYVASSSSSFVGNFLSFTQGGSSILAVKGSSGNVGIATSSPWAKLSVAGGAVVTGHSAFGANAGIDDIDPFDGNVQHNTIESKEIFTSTGVDHSNGIYSEAIANTGAGVAPGIFNAVKGIARNLGTSVTSNVTGLRGTAMNDSTGSVTNAYGVYGNVELNNGAGTITNAYGGRFDVNNSGGGILTNAYGAYIDNVTTFATNGYGLYVASQGLGATNYSLYTAGTSKSFFGGNVGIGTTSPYAKLSVAGQVVADYFTATSTTATSTFYGDLAVGSTGVIGSRLTINKTSTATVAGNEFGISNTVSDTGVTTSGTDGIYGLSNILTHSGATAGTNDTYGVYNNMSIDDVVSGTSNSYGIYTNMVAGPNSTTPDVSYGAYANLVGGTAYGSKTIFNNSVGVSTGYGMSVGPGALTGLGINTVYGTYVGNFTSATNVNGLYVDDQGTSATHYSIYTAGNTKSYFGGNVGIGTTSPYAKLSVVGDVVASSFNATSTTATSTFTAGVKVGAGNGYWIGNANVLATNATAVSNNIVSGAAGNFAVGIGNVATSSATPGVALGTSNIVNSTLGGSAVGISNTASDYLASSFGAGNRTQSQESSAFGRLNIAAGAQTVAFGYNNNAQIDFAVAVGSSNNASGLGSGAYAFGSGNTASGDAASAFGLTNTASGDSSSAFGNSNIASGFLSSVFGYSSQATSTGALAVGYATKAGGGNSVALGNTVSAFAASSIAIGKGVTNTTANSLQIGPSDAAKLTILSTGNVGIGTTSPYAKLSVVGDVVADSFNATSTTATSTFTAGVNVGSGNGYYVNGARAISGGSALPTSLGFTNTVSSLGIALGNSNISNNIFSTAIGYSNSATSSVAVAIGLGNNAGGVSSSAIGISNGSYASNSIAVGANIINNIASSLMIGPSDTAKLTILSSGYMGIGTTTPTGNLSIAGTAGQTANLFTVASSTGVNRFTIGADGRTSITRDTVNSYDGNPILNISGTRTLGNLTGDPATPLTGVKSILAVTPTSNDGDFFSGSWSQATYNAAFTYGGGIAGSTNVAKANFGGANTLSNIYGTYNYADMTGGSGTVTNAYGSYNQAWNFVETVTNAYGVYSSVGGGSGMITNGYGLYVPDMTTGAVVNPWAIYTAGNTKSYFGGNVGIGTTSPYAALSVVGASGVVADIFTATSTTATSTFAGNLSAARYNIGGAIAIDFGSGSTNIMMGRTNSSTVSAGNSMAIGFQNTVTGTVGNTALGWGNTVSSATGGVALGKSNTVSVTNGVAIGTGITNSIGGLMIGPSDASKVTIQTNGNVGIGTSTTPYKLMIQNTYGSMADLFDVATTTSSAFATSSLFRVTAAGSIGIGTSTPYSKLTVNTGDIGAYNGAICADNGGTVKCFGALTAGNVYGDGSSFVASDVAENYPVADSSIEAGDIIVLAPTLSDDEKAKRERDRIKLQTLYKSEAPNSIQESLDVSIAKATSGGSGTVLGIISTRPGVLLGDTTGLALETAFKPVTLSGRVPLKVSAENGAIVKGDSITLSSIPGVGAKATATSSITVATALEDFTSTDTAATGTILAFVNLQHDEAGLQLEHLVSLTGSSTDSTTDNTFVGRFFERMRTWLADTTNGIAQIAANIFRGKEFHAEDKLCIGAEGNETCVTKTQLDQLLQNQMVASPAASTGSQVTTPDPVDTSVATPPVATSTDPIIPPVDNSATTTGSGA